jgi:hypothetical protein
MPDCPGTHKTDGFVKSSISALRFSLRNFTYCKVRCIPQALRAPNLKMGLELFTLPPNL